MKNKIHINLDYYFPSTVIFLGVVTWITGMFLLFGRAIFGVPLILFSLIIFTARYRLVINLTEQSYHDYLWIAGIKKGEKGKFGSIENLFINKNRYQQTVNSRISTMAKHGTEYNGYIKFDMSDVHLVTSDNKSKVVKKLMSIRKELSSNVILSTSLTINNHIIDYTDGEPKEIV